MRLMIFLMAFFAISCTAQDVKCQPGTYTCGQSSLGIAILVCDISSVWEVAAHCGTGQLCQDAHGAAYCY